MNSLSPPGIQLTDHEFAAAFPYHFVFDRAGQIVQFGPQLRQLCPGLSIGDRVADRFRIERPHIDFDHASISRNLPHPFLLRCAAHASLLQGRMLAKPETGQLLFLGSPWAESPGDPDHPEDLPADHPTLGAAVEESRPQWTTTEIKKLRAQLLQQRAELQQCRQELHQCQTVLQQTELAQRRDRGEFQLLRLVAARGRTPTVVTDALGHTLWINEAFNQLTGYSLVEAKGRLPTALCQGPHSDRAALDSVSNQFRLTRPFQAELILYRKSGQPFWFSLQAEPVTDEQGTIANYLVTGVDTTERKRAEDSLRWEKERLWSTLDCLAEGVVVVDQFQNVQLLNRSAEQITGWSSPSASGHPLHEVLSLESESERSIAGLLAVAIARREVVGHLNSMREKMNLRGRHGGSVAVVPSAVPIISPEGAVTGGLIIFRDISAPLVNQRLRQEFVEAVSHELNTPLTSISGFLSNLRREPDMPIALRQEFLGIITDQVARLRCLVKDILEVSRIESKEVDLENEPVDLRQPAFASLQEVQPQADEKSLQLLCELPEIPLPIVADSARLQTVLTSLLTNAIKFTPPGGTVELCLSRQEGELVIQVRDTGVGIPADSLAHIFEKFYRVPRTGSMQLPGSGLGLAIVQRIVQLLHGRIEVESTPNVETRFRVFLPSQPESVAPQPG